MWLLYIGFGAVGIYFWLQILQGSNALDALKAGKYGPFDVSAVSSDGTAYIAIDEGRRRIALVNISTPSFAGDRDFRGYYNGTHVLELADLEFVACTVNLKSKSGSVMFKTTRPIPEPNCFKYLEMGGGKGTKEFFQRKAPWIPFQYTEKA